MFGVYCFTGLRRGDASKLGKQHIRNGVITIDTEKSQGQMRVTIPVLPELAEIIAAGPTGDLSIIASKKGQSIRKESLGTMFKKACKLAGIPNKSAHGIRKASDPRGEQWRHGSDPGGDIRLGRWPDGRTLYPRRRSAPARRRAHGKTVQIRNLYSRT
jgi:integrase